MGFRPVFSTLGVEFDLRGASQGVLRVGNTEKRKVELKSMVEKHLAVAVKKRKKIVIIKTKQKTKKT